MRGYRPSVFSNDPRGFQDAVRREFDSLREAANRAEPFILLQILYAQPERMYAGMVVYADGTTWNPGSGEGMYRRNVANAAWVFIG